MTTKSTDRPRPTRLRFGPFEADLVSGELFENEKLVPLQTKPFQFLATLLRNHGEIVLREAIAHSLWPAVYVQVNQGLNAAVRKARMALHDDAHNPRFIETIDSRGYRFIHATEVLRWSTDAVDVPDVPVRVAVLPFQFQDEGDAELAGGLTRQVLNGLGCLHPRLIAVGASELPRVPGEKVQPGPGAETGEVSHVLSGTCSGRSRNLELTFALTGVRDGVRVWEKTYDVPKHGVPAVLDEVCTKVIQNFRSICSTASAVPSWTTAWHGYEEFLRGECHLGRRTAEGLQAAAGHYRKSVELDRNFVPALVNLARTSNLLAVRGWAEPRVAYQQSLEHAKRALGLDPNSPEAMVELGWSTLALQRDWATATRLFERCLEARPNLVTAHCYYAFLLLSRTRFDDAVSQLEIARRARPRSLNVNNHLAMSYYYSRQYEDAISQSQFSLLLDPNCVEAHALIGMSMLAEQKLNHALEHFQLSLEHSNGDAGSIARLAYAQAHAGRFQIAESMLRKIEGQFEVLPAYDMALVHLALGDVNQAFRWLEMAYRQCSHWVLLMGLDPRLDLLRGSRRFDELYRMLLPVDGRRVAGAN